MFISGLKLFKEQGEQVELLLENAFDFSQSKKSTVPYFKYHCISFYLRTEDCQFSDLARLYLLMLMEIRLMN